MLIPSTLTHAHTHAPSLSRRVNANSQRSYYDSPEISKLIKKGEC